MFVCAMNPCPCGYYGDGEKPCICSVPAVKKYQSKISGPLLDRMDMILTIEREYGGYGDWGKQESDNNITQGNQDSDSPVELKKHILQAHHRQQQRYKNSIYNTNSEVAANDIETYMPLDKECRDIIAIATKKLSLSLRVVHKTIRLARSIADFDDAENIRKQDILEALQYRSQ